MTPRVYIGTPYRADPDRYVRVCEALMKLVFDCGGVPIATQPMYHHIPVEHLPERRQLVLDVGMDFLDQCDVAIFHQDISISSGMQAELAKCRKCGIYHYVLDWGMHEELTEGWLMAVEMQIKHAIAVCVDMSDFTDRTHEPKWEAAADGNLRNARLVVDPCDINTPPIPTTRENHHTFGKPSIADLCKEILEQLDMCDPRDELGHEFRMNKSIIDLRERLRAPC